MPSASEIRQQFIDFFVKKCGHTFVPSSPCVPHDDPTLMFANAGMNQFKPIFLGQQAPDVDKWPGVVAGMATRAANSQKCIRAGGKHNDLDDVGHDTYHHTFFEMLGNWSFGDYFKTEAIEWAWELLTSVWGIDGSRLHATYFEGDPAEGLEPDNEARDLWLKILPPERVHPGNKKDNFWEMGDTGPCGPCSEIHIDLTPDKSGGPLVNAGDARVIEIWNLVFIQFSATWLEGGEAKMREFDTFTIPAAAKDDKEARRKALRDKFGAPDRNTYLGQCRKLTLLPAKHVDTGMGFERVSAVLQGMEAGRLGQFSNYDTDVFTPIFAAIQKVTGAGAYEGLLEHAADGASRDAVMRDVTYRVIADHIRTLTFALTDGAVPSNDGRGYVLRRILRRAVRYGRQFFGMEEPFLHKLVPVVAEVMSDAFPELKTAHAGRNVERVSDIVLDEEASFGKTLDRGIALFEEAAAYAIEHHDGCIGGESAFKMHDTFGFPIDLTELMAAERGLTVNKGDYELRMRDAKEKARAAGKGLGDEDFEELQAMENESKTQLEQSSTPNPTVDNAKYSVGEGDIECEAVFTSMAIGSAGYEAHAGQPLVFSLNTTCFYAEQGGQVADHGFVTTEDGEIEVTRVTRGSFHWSGKTYESVHHFGRVTRGVIRPHSSCRVRVPRNRRRLIEHNHTATHILNWALRDTLGDHVMQKGSLVDPDKTRFDLSHNAAISAAELARIETLVNEQIDEDMPVYAEEADQKEALQIETLRAVFGEKYPDRVRVVSIGVPVKELLMDPKRDEWMKYSVEFCGGTHVQRTGEIQRFRLIEESAVAKGVRRVTGITGAKAREAEKNAERLAQDVEGAVKKASGADADVASLETLFNTLNAEVNESELPIVEKSRLRERLGELQEHLKKLKKAQARASAADVMGKLDEVLASAEQVGDVKICCANLGEAGVEQMRSAADSLRDRAQSAAILLAGVSGDRVVLLAAMTKDLVGKGVKAGDLIREIAPIVGGKGGGRPDMAQGGGEDTSRIDEAIAAARSWVSGKLG
ncbi:MAG TPA: alanine--tRNA ligase [Phycisphaerae bacterium]|nr:alanine--tRNA ligase [Phycisphaerae bacterium]HRW53356.1 alanine--tRNA ligase [Phycisphaerae bacterium]